MWALVPGLTCTQFLVISLCKFNAAYLSAVLLEVSRRLAGSNMVFGEFQRGQITQRTMRTITIIIVTSQFDLITGIGQ